MNMYKKYLGIDSRDIRCVSKNPNSIEAGISFDSDEDATILRFHFLEFTNTRKPFLTETTKHMHLSKETRDELVKQLQSLEF